MTKYYKTEERKRLVNARKSRESRLRLNRILGYEDAKVRSKEWNAIPHYIANRRPAPTGLFYYDELEFYAKLAAMTYVKGSETDAVKRDIRKARALVDRSIHLAINENGKGRISAIRNSIASRDKVLNMNRKEFEEYVLQNFCWFNKKGKYYMLSEQCFYEFGVWA